MQDIETRDISDMIEIALSTWKEGERPTFQIDIRGQTNILEIITLRTDCVTLNHQNNRLSAQLQDLPNAKQLMQNPTSVETQKAIAELLAATDKFSNLKLELETHGQKEPGLITRDGLLVNGNTRAAALLQLSHLEHAKGIKVAVLPKGVLEDDIIELEMSLQMRRLTHQDYSYTNELLFMHKYLERGKSSKELAATMGWIRRGEAKVNQKMRILGIIDWTRNKAPLKNLSYSTFDTKSTHLEDLDKEMQSLVNEGNNTAAEQLKHERIFAILLNINKDQTREIDSGFISDNIYGSRAENENSSLNNFLTKFQPSRKPTDDLTDFLDEEEVLPIDTVKLLNTFLSEPGTLNEDGTLTADLEGGFAELAREMKEATDLKVNQGRQKSRAQEMASIIRSIRQDITNVVEVLPERYTDPLFKKGDFEYELNKAKRELEKLSDLFASYP